jgi:hypothetical protein
MSQLLADIVAKVGKGQLGSKNAQQSNRNEWIFESALRIGAQSWINVAHSDAQNLFATISAKSGHHAGNALGAVFTAACGVGGLFALCKELAQQLFEGLFS